MKGYRFAVEWIALNDANGDSDRLDIDSVSSFISVGLVADIFEKTMEQVARDVVLFRIKEDKKANPDPSVNLANDIAAAQDDLLEGRTHALVAKI